MNPAAGAKPLLQGDPPSGLFTEIRQIADHPALNGRARCRLIDLLHLLLHGVLANRTRIRVPGLRVQGNVTE
jgi:hypothetical protein